jgi:prepilin-type N-terminal cleavage/methylation domain-containing protein
MRNKRGFTLIEVLITLVLVVAVAALMYTFMGQGLSLYTHESRTAAEQDSLRQVLSDITNRVRLTDASEISVTDGVLTVGDTEYSYDSTGKRILRDGSEFARDISAFSAALNGTQLEISVTNTGDTVVSTSLSLAG